jgi:hypothetical protein
MGFSRVESPLQYSLFFCSWFRMKHRSRLEREEKEDVEIKGFEQANKEAQGSFIVLCKFNLSTKDEALVYSRTSEHY